jgi:hypothetical protein
LEVKVLPRFKTPLVDAGQLKGAKQLVAVPQLAPGLEEIDTVAIDSQRKVCGESARVVLVVACLADVEKGARVPAGE